MAYTVIDKPSEYFGTLLWTGDNTNNRDITGLDFTPDFTWIKIRSGAGNHGLFDSVRGADKSLRANETRAEDTSANNDLDSFISGGIRVDASNAIDTNTNGYTIVAWNWRAGTAFTNDASATGVGSIDSAGSVNTDAGFSIVSWTGNGADATIAHGLSQAPTIYFVKNRADAADWRVGQVLTSSNNMTDGNGYYMELNDTKASTNPGSATLWGSTPTAPTSSVFTVGSNNANNGSSDAMIAYCFHSVKGYSKFGSYTGNGNANGTFVYTGFKPAMIITKANAVADWFIRDNKQDPENVMNEYLSPNTTATSGNLDSFDFVSNGFKIRNSNNAWNGSGTTYIYMAFAENPLVTSTGIPATAR